MEQMTNKERQTICADFFNKFGQQGENTIRLNALIGILRNHALLPLSFRDDLMVERLKHLHNIGRNLEKESESQQGKSPLHCRIFLFLKKRVFGEVRD